MLFLVVLAGLGCGYPKLGHLRDSSTSYDLSLREFMFVDNVAASSQSYSLLCVIDLNPNVYPYRDNMKSLHEQADLKPNQALVNFREDHKFWTFFLLVCSFKDTLAADVVQFDPDLSTIPVEAPSASQIVAPPKALSNPAPGPAPEWAVAKDCASGGAAACREDATVLLRGDRTNPDIMGRAYALMKQACDGQDGKGCALLSEMYLKGLGHTKDLNAARRTLDKACRLGHKASCRE
jgi:hypothetical protein